MDLPRWLDDPHKKAGRVKDEGGQIEMGMCTETLR
jgi:hypothetical protein